MHRRRPLRTAAVTWTNTVFTVLDDQLATFGQAEHFAGDNSDGGDPGYLCSGTSAVTSTITRHGFVPFTDDGLGNFCREI